MRREIEAEIAAAGLTARFTLTGNRSDIPQILKAGIDVFVFPSEYEGLPLSLMEAQAAGLRCVVSDAITPNAALQPGMVRWISLTAPLSAWTDAIQEAIESGDRPVLSNKVLQQLSIESCVRKLTELYDSNLRNKAFAGQRAVA